jgi:hypothetical protein
MRMLNNLTSKPKDEKKQKRTQQDQIVSMQHQEFQL